MSQENMLYPGHQNYFPPYRVEMTKRKNQKKGYMSDNVRKVLSFFDLKNTLCAQEIILSLYKKHNILKERQWALSTLFNLERRGFLTKVKSGVYKLK